MWGALVTLVACNTATTSVSLSKSDAAGTDSSGGDSAGSPVVETDDGAASLNEAATTDVAWPWDATTAPDAGYPAPMACDMDASPEASITECPPPFSTCGNFQQLVYFGWGQCVAGSCSWPQMTMTCRWGCSGGGCLAAPTM